MALISGTKRGLGRAAALRFAAEGALVIGGDLLHAEAVETRRLIAREGGTALTPGPSDVTDEDSVRTWVAEAAAAFGGLDIACAESWTAAGSRSVPARSHERNHAREQSQRQRRRGGRRHPRRRHTRRRRFRTLRNP
ncbi:SDR family oxidoreductase [Streptomyces sp. NPDC058637]|uniref:SDR family oxidoreductase n=1 Tax=Streptomyces sp. NPDC058637 TaxID=3346569 RepID=UPI00364D3F34